MQDLRILVVRDARGGPRIVARICLLYDRRARLPNPRARRDAPNAGACTTRVSKRPGAPIETCR
ncbi:hypothetical protein OH687_11525 [Burkholderia anthina]|nr:hypothetical protein OH687_11525 [Burkholderia anthina]